jgi:NAD-specific glutamate dehydrogenase
LPLSNDLAFSRDDLFSAVRALAPAKTDADDPALLAFLEQYHADAFLEDFLALTTEDSAALALGLWDFNRQNEAHDRRAIRVRRAIGAGGRPLRLDVVEIVGPDIAFLVDSAIVACQEARVEIRAALHPVIAGPKGRAGLNKRTWNCVCGAIHDRDVNAALNVRALGLKSLEVGVPA